MSQYQIDRDFRDGRFDDAIAGLEKGLAKVGDGKDQLLYLLDLGLIHHTKRDYKKSNEYFLKADQIVDLKDYTSLSTEAATLVVSDNIKHYKGEDFENVLVSTYLAMNFSAMGDWEGALVEARRVNRKLYLMVNEGKRKYKQNAFARYLSAILYEAKGELDSAYIDYKKTYELKPEYQPLKEDLWRMSRVLRRELDEERWQKEFQLAETAKKRIMEESSKAEIVIIFENGIGPEKRPHPNFHSVPKFYVRPNPVVSAKVLINGEEKITTQVLEDIEATAIANLDEKWGGILAKKIGGVVAKEVVSQGVAGATDSPLLGAFTRLALHAADQADIRSWGTLPKDLQISRVRVDPGSYEVNVKPEGMSPLTQPIEVQVNKGEKVIIPFRFVPL